MVNCCYASNCDQKQVPGGEVSFHLFPRDPELKNKWLVALGKKGTTPLEESRVCSKHFSADSYVSNGWTTKKTLRDDAVPLSSEKSIMENSFTDVICISTKLNGSVKCTECDHSFATKNELTLHTKLLHKASVFKCTTCDALFKKKYGCNRHIISKHGRDALPTEVKRKLLAKKQKLMKNNGSKINSDQSRTNVSSATPKLTCPICDDILKTYKGVDRHLEDKHNIIQVVESKTFTSLKDFENWKEEVERKTATNFIKRRRLSDKVVFHCNKSGNGKQILTDEEELKSFVKLGKCCPSRMVLSRKNETKVVNFYKTHIHYLSKNKCDPLVTSEERLELPRRADSNDRVDVLCTSTGVCTVILSDVDVQSSNSFKLAQVIAQLQETIPNIPSDRYMEAIADAQQLLNKYKNYTTGSNSHEFVRTRNLFETEEVIIDDLFCQEVSNDRTSNNIYIRNLRM